MSSEFKVDVIDHEIKIDGNKITAKNPDKDKMWCYTPFGKKFIVFFTMLMPTNCLILEIFVILKFSKPILTI
jgi:hypothetical protein